jgi:hypothetical protein
VLVIGNNADVDLGNFTLTATGGLTIVFTGTNKPGFVTGKGAIDFRAPTSGAWSGIALYQNPALGAGQSKSAGNGPNFFITGLIYASKTDLDINGAINKSTNGLTCVGIVAANVGISGQGSILQNATSQCYDAGLTQLPTVAGSGGARQALVQ